MTNVHSLLTALLLAPLAGIQATEPVLHFITRQGDKLYDGDQEFRCIGANMPGLWLPYDFR
jgi:hypothetical protein